MKKIFIIFSLLMVLILAGAVLAEEPAKAPPPGAGPGPGAGLGPGPGMGPLMGPHMRWWDLPQLNLTPEQKTKLDAQFQTYQQEMIPLRNSLVEKRRELENLIGEVQLDKDKILQKYKELAAVQNTLEEKRINFEIAQRLVLTPEQRSLIVLKRPQPRGPRGPQ